MKKISGKKGPKQTSYNNSLSKHHQEPAAKPIQQKRAEIRHDDLKKAQGKQTDLNLFLIVVGDGCEQLFSVEEYCVYATELVGYGQDYCQAEYPLFCGT